MTDPRITLDRQTCVRLAELDLARLDVEVARRRARGERPVSRSSVIREALERQLDAQEGG